ncbi:MAG: hypothetical protein SVU32_00775, partial [Candidatus Nanohaloarchaea archaeon]|nr:hypothetical protein [Candidatus Nanohaloarchaea archaeon]
MNYRTLGLLLILITFASLTTAQIQNGAFTSSNGWSSFVDRLDSCKEDSVCTTSDSMGEQVVKNNKLHLDSGTTGFCGEAGFRQVVSVPEDAQYLLVDAVATKDYWGGNHLGVQINGEFVKQFAVADQPKSETWGPDVFRVNASQYAGRVVNLSLVLGDDSREWCNMGDHGHSLTVDHIAFASSYQDARIEHVQVPETISAGTSFSATVVFTNTGTETFKGDVRLLDIGKFGATVDVEEQYSDGVAPGQTVNVTLNVKIPSDVQLDSTETLTAYVNRIWQGDGRYSFLDTQDVTVQTEDALPDSIETNFYPETVSPGETYNMTFETTRNGERVSATVNMSIYIDGELKESSTGELTDGFRSTSGAFPGPQDVSYFQEGTWKLVATTTGTSGAISDSDTFEVVTDTSGNTTGLAAEIVSIQAPSSVAVGGSFQINVTVRNTGTEPYSGYIFFGDADGYYGNSRDIEDLIGSALDPGETATVTLPAGVARPSRVEKGHEPVPGEREKLAVELGLENSVDSLDRELYSVYVRNGTTGTDGKIVNVSGIERPVSPGEPVYIDVVVKNTGNNVLNGTLRAQHTMESLSTNGMAASSRVKTRDIYLLEGVTNRHVIQFTTSETPGVHMIEFEL